MSDDIWEVLGIAPTRDRDTIRRAYARKLRATNPEDDAEGFMRLREAHDEAVARIDWDWMWEDEEEGAGDDGDLLVRAAPLVTTEGPSPSIVTPSAEKVELETRFERLELLLRGADRPPADVLEAAFHAVLNAEALEEIAVAAAVEDRVADLLLEAAPRSDPLLAPAINAFRWRRDDLRFWPTSTAQAIIERADFVESRDRMLKFDDYGAKAIELLQGPPSGKLSWLSRLDPGYDRAMKDILARIGDDNGALMADFNPETVAAWRDHYSRPRPTPAMGAAVAIAALVGLIAGLTIDRGPLMLAAATLGAPLAVVGALLAYFLGYLRLKTSWEIHRSWRAGIFERIGWAPLSLMLLPVAALLPDAWWSTAVVMLAGGIALAWTFATTEPPPADTFPLHHRLLRQGVPFAWIFSLTLFDVDIVTPPVFVALAIASVIDFRGCAQTTQAWHLELGRFARLGGNLALLASALAIGVAAWGAAGETPPDWAPLCVAMILALAIAHRPSVAGLGENLARVRYYGMFAVYWLLKGIHGFDDSWLLISSLWMLGGMIVGVVLSQIVEFRDRTQQA